MGSPLRQPVCLFISVQSLKGIAPSHCAGRCLHFFVPCTTMISFSVFFSLSLSLSLFTFNLFPHIRTICFSEAYSTSTFSCPHNDFFFFLINFLFQDYFIIFHLWEGKSELFYSQPFPPVFFLSPHPL